MAAVIDPQSNPNLAKELIPGLFDQVGIAAEKAFRMLWDIGMTYLSGHWVAVTVGLIAIFLIALMRAFVTGRWALLGSIVYNYLYFGALFAVGLIWGPEVFASDLFKIVLVILYATCFFLTGRFLRKIRIAN
jgi:hypothetical protein